MNASATTVPADTGRSQAAEELVDRLSRPETVASLNELLDSIGTLNFLLNATGGFLARGDEIMENAAESYQELAQVAKGDTSGSLQRVMKLAGQAIPVAERVADSDLLDRLGDPAVIATLSALVESIQRAQAAVAANPSAHEPGAFKLAGALKDPDVRRGLGFAVQIMKELGQALG
jgi:uncharacterized protein YjgD (DUF1641 family)